MSILFACFIIVAFFLFIWGRLYLKNSTLDKMVWLPDEKLIFSDRPTKVRIQNNSPTGGELLIGARFCVTNFRIILAQVALFGREENAIIRYMILYGASDIFKDVVQDPVLTGWHCLRTNPQNISIIRQPDHDEITIESNQNSRFYTGDPHEISFRTRQGELYKKLFSFAPAPDDGENQPPVHLPE